MYVSLVQPPFHKGGKRDWNKEKQNSASKLVTEI